MLDDPVPVFISPNRSIAGNAFIGMLLFVVFCNDYVFEFLGDKILSSPVLYLLSGAILLFYILYGTGGASKKMQRVPDGGFIFNAVRVYSDSLLFFIHNKGHESQYDRISISNIKDIRVTELTTESMFRKNTVEAFEFFHSYGKSRFLRFDINNREKFERLLNEKGLQIEGERIEAQN